VHRSPMSVPGFSFWDLLWGSVTLIVVALSVIALGLLIRERKGLPGRFAALRAVLALVAAMVAVASSTWLFSPVAVPDETAGGEIQCDSMHAMSVAQATPSDPEQPLDARQVRCVRKAQRIVSAASIVDSLALIVGAGVVVSVGRRSRDGVRRIQSRKGP
jgi:amino acid transporter